MSYSLRVKKLIETNTFKFPSMVTSDLLYVSLFGLKLKSKDFKVIKGIRFVSKKYYPCESREIIHHNWNVSFTI